MSVFSAGYAPRFALILAVALFGCSSTDKSTTGSSNGAASCPEGACTDAGASGGANGAQSAGPNGSTSAGGNDGTDAGDPNEVVDCAKIEVEAKLVKKPVDIIWVVDSSGSMGGEAKIVQDNMNTFAASIAGSGLDYRVVVMTKQGFLNVPDPLGSDAAHFLFVDENVDSNEALDALINRFDDYSGFLRPDAVTHVIPVTDDEARKEGNGFSSNRNELTRDWFIEEMSRLLQHEFTLHAVASESPKCKGAANPGVIHYMIAAATSGLTFSICSADWSGLFAQLSSAVASSAPIECAFDLPPPPDGKTFDKDKVNVRTKARGASDFTIIGRTTAADACQSGGWHYDDPSAPKRIQICESTCMELRKQLDGSLEIQLGCETVIVRPQ